MTVWDRFQRCLHSSNLNGASGTGLTVIRAVVVHKDKFSIPYSYEFHRISMDEVLETLRNMSKYDFFVWAPQAMKADANKSNECSSKYISEQNEKEAEG